MGRKKRERSQRIIIPASSPLLQSIYARARSIEHSSCTTSSSSQESTSSTSVPPILSSPSLEYFFTKYSSIKATLLTKEHKNIAEAIGNLSSLIEEIINHPKKNMLNTNLIKCYYLKAACIFYLEARSDMRSTRNRIEACESIKKAKELGFEVSKTLSTLLRSLNRYRDNYQHRMMITEDYPKDKFLKQTETILEHALDIKFHPPSPSYISPRF